MSDAACVFERQPLHTLSPIGWWRGARVEGWTCSGNMRLAMDMLYFHLPLIPSARGQKVEAELVGLPHQGRSQLWAAMPTDEVAGLPGMAGLH